MKCIDFEAHYYPEEFVEVMCKRTELPRLDLKKDMMYYTAPDGCVEWHLIAGQGGIDLLDIAEHRIREMDESRTDMQVLSAAQGIEMLPPESGIAVAHAANLGVYKAMQNYPGRFQGMAALPLTDVEASVKEMTLCAEEYGFIGVNLFSSLGNGNYPDDDKYEPIFAKAAELGLFVYLHPAFAGSERLHGAGSQLVTACLGFGVDTLITFARLLAKGVLDRYPDLKIFLGHFGEGIPFIYGRFTNMSLGPDVVPEARGQARNMHKFDHYVQKNLYVTSSGMDSITDFNLTKEILGIDKILFGSDYPMDRPHARTRRYIESIPMTLEEREKVLYKNAQTLFGL